ncbi:hypothetical protein DM01DRAFT_1406603 [Hesseltinella vesiculosa]|uniref:Zinc finger PHD-type domain-containing protein n=1 Tax=Hesseltinella vesiculosa TaxID=101127 RepID=A0A1X2GL17_9FUNG|nr:hypothetical protein DM01DRAFT_1406603 [Hesseltinella vesiculosa]
MALDGSTLITLRNNIEFASIAQFLHTYQHAFRPWPAWTDTYESFLYSKHLTPNDDYVFATEDLEQMFLDPSKRIFLQDLFVRLLRVLTRNRFLNDTTWEQYLAKEYDKRADQDLVNPFFREPELDQTKEPEHPEDSPNNPQPIAYSELSLASQVHVLHELCEWQLDFPDRFREHLETGEDERQWRVEPIGFDAKGDTYWLFDDNRLYRQSDRKPPKKKATKRKRAPPPPSSRSTRRTRTAESQPTQHNGNSEDEQDWSPWQLLCRTVADWRAFPQRYADSQHVDEKRFYKLLANDVVPKVIPAIEEHEAEIQKAAAMALRKRSSRIMVRELEALEQQQFNMMSRSSSNEPELTRSERRRLQQEQDEKDRQSRARQERAQERERKIEEQRYVETLAAEKSRLERERRLLLRQGHADSDLYPDSMSPPALDASPSHPTQPLDQPEGKPKRKYTKKIKDKDKTITVNITMDDTPKKPKKPKRDPNAPPKKRGRKSNAQKLLELQQRQQEEEDGWMFRCLCGVQGLNIDDGAPMIACEKCAEWQHIECLRNSNQIPRNSHALEQFVFICRRCLADQEGKMDLDIDVVDHPMENRTIVESSAVPASQPFAVAAHPPPSPYAIPSAPAMPSLQRTIAIAPHPSSSMRLVQPPQERQTTLPARLPPLHQMTSSQPSMLPPSNIRSNVTHSSTTEPRPQPLGFTFESPPQHYSISPAVHQPPPAPVAPLPFSSPVACQPTVADAQGAKLPPLQFAYSSVDSTSAPPTHASNFPSSAIDSSNGA